MTLRTVFMFSGQGSHHHQMGRELLDGDVVFRETLQRLDALAQRQLGESVVEAIYAHGKDQPFERTMLTHPAIFMVEYALARSLIHGGVEPDLTLGASLGAFAAAAVAGYLDETQALAAVIKQAAAFEACCARGGMLAVLGEPRLCETGLLRERSELAGVNFASHFVLSAQLADLPDVEAELRRRDVAYHRLPVAYAYHSRGIEPARAPFEAFLRFSLGTRPRTGSLPLVCCEQAQVLQALPADFLWRVVRGPIRFRDTITALERTGPYRYVDVGPSGTLANFVKYALPAGSRSTSLATLTPFGHDRRNVAVLLHASSSWRRIAIDSRSGPVSLHGAPSSAVSTRVV
jgi:bacillaene synthase trans-acting acyltransferase